MTLKNIPLEDLRYVLLDMDGTLLDKYFDDFFWEHLVPEKYAMKHRVTFGKAKEELMDKYKAHERTLNWTDLFTREKLSEAGVDLSYGPGVHGLSAAARKFQQLEALQEAALLTVLRAAWLSAESQPNNLEASISKAKGGSAVRQITQGCIELLGPMGISREHLLEKWFRDVRITDIYEGTGQIQHLIIARTILGYGRNELK